MSIHYIIDGYNVIKQIAYFTEKRLEEGRNSFIKFLETSRPQGSFNNQVTVVFDGKSEIIYPKKMSSIEVIFTNDETADDKIKRMVNNSPNRRRLIVVTDDKGIKFFVRDLGTKTMSVKNFLSKVKEKPFKLTSGGTDKPELMSEEAKQINNELQKIWWR